MKQKCCIFFRARSLGGVTRKYYGKCGEPKQRARYYMYKK
jgi:hypothetical protein